MPGSRRMLGGRYNFSTTDAASGPRPPASGSEPLAGGPKAALLLLPSAPPVFASRLFGVLSADALVWGGPVLSSFPFFSDPPGWVAPVCMPALVFIDGDGVPSGPYCDGNAAFNSQST